MEIASAVAAWVGASSGVLALMWQIATRRRSAHRVIVERSSSIILGGDDYDVDARPTVMLRVTARNVGAAPVTIEGWGIQLGRNGGGIVVVNPLPRSARLPQRLEAGGSLDVFGISSLLRQSADEHGVPPSKLRAFVRLGTGETVFATRGCPI